MRLNYKITLFRNKDSIWFFKIRIMPKTMDTSQWIIFFTKAGLPPNVAANYALIFSENRIQVDMLLDLSKEYLYDMGIKIMGDVIAILKYAKEFHNQLAKQRLMGNSTPSYSKAAYGPSTSYNKAAYGPIPSYSKTAVAERLVGRYTRPVSAPTIRASPVQLQRTSKPKIISLKRKASPQSLIRMKARRVPPEEEGAYKIKMPLGTTEKTRKIMQQQAAGTKRSVFTRLGDSAVSSTTDVNKVSSSVFERLGPTSKNQDNIPTSTVLGDFESPKRAGAALPYQGVLKMTIGKNRTVVSTLPQKNTLITRTVMKPTQRGVPSISKSARLNQINAFLQQKEPIHNRISQRTTGSFASQRTIGQKSALQRLGIQSRLGNQVSAVKTKILMKGNAHEKGVSNVFARLGR